MSKVLTVDKALWRFVRETLFQYAALFNIKLKKVKPMPMHKPWYGDCDNAGRVRIQIRFDSKEARFTGPLLPYHIIDTMAHELAHVRHNKHTPAWFRLHCQLLSAMEDGGVFKRLRKLHRARR